MKEWIVIHQIKALHHNGNGLSIRQIAKQLSISRNTVSKYLNLSEPEMTAKLSDTDRAKKLDDYRDYIIQLLQTYPELSAVKVIFGVSVTLRFVMSEIFYTDPNYS